VRFDHCFKEKAKGNPSKSWKWWLYIWKIWSITWAC